jgi:adenylosuccinate synthase
MTQLNHITYHNKYPCTVFEFPEFIDENTFNILKNTFPKLSLETFKNNSDGKFSFYSDSEHFVNQYLRDGKKVLAEGAQGTMLDIDFGSYPFVTSSNTTTAGACTGLGVAPKNIGHVIGIFKAYCTRVGSGPFQTELDNETGEELRKIGHEFGATTGRPRRCVWIDLPALKYAIMLNGVSEMVMTKADVLSGFETIYACTHYKYNGEVVDYMPYDINAIKAEPIFEAIPGW